MSRDRLGIKLLYSTMLKMVMRGYFVLSRKLGGLDVHEKYMWIFLRFHLEGLLDRLDIATISPLVESQAPSIDRRLTEFVNKLY